MAARTARRLSGLDLAVIGAGYVGLVTAACLVRLGHRATVVEVNPQRLAALLNGHVPFHEPDLQALVGEGLRSGDLQATGDAAVALAHRDAILVCVGTPLDEHGEADQSQLRSACAAIRAHGSDTTVIVRSTLPLGLWRSVASWLGRTDLRTLATNPEFLRQGSAVSDFLSPMRIVIGTHDGVTSTAAVSVKEMYGRFEAPVIVTDYDSADMIKNAANAFLATKLSFINEIADLCEAYGADVEQVIEGIGLDPRIGRTYLRPGIGFGGSCLPKELANLMRLGQKKNLPVRLLNAASQENGDRARRIADRIDHMVGGLVGRRVAQLGLSFKPDTDDLRHSPALVLARALLERGASVVAHDPVVPAASTADLRELERCTDVISACTGADLVVLATEWAVYRELDWSHLRSIVARPFLFDGRNALDADTLRRAGWELGRIGHAYAGAAHGTPLQPWARLSDRPWRRVKLSVSP